MKAEADKRAESVKKGPKGKEAKEDTAYKEKFRAALPYLEKVGSSRKDDALLWQQLGKIYANLNMVDKSKAAFEQYDRIVKGK
jgi:predicted Zn-dependent protease